MDKYADNWVYELRKVPESAHKALEKVKKDERAKINKGYRWVRANHYTKILVPCDMDGRPTKEGQEKVDSFNKK